MALVNKKRLKELEADVVSNSQLGGTSPLDDREFADIFETVWALRVGLAEALALYLGEYVETGKEDAGKDPEWGDYKRLEGLLEEVS